MKEEITAEQQEEIRSLALQKELDRNKRRLQKERKGKMWLIISLVVMCAVTIGIWGYFAQEVRTLNTELNHYKVEKDSVAVYIEQLVSSNKLLFNKVDSLKNTSQLKKLPDNNFMIQLGAFKSPGNPLQQDLSIKLIFDDQLKLYRFRIYGFQTKKDAKAYLTEIRNIDLSKAFIVN